MAQYEFKQNNEARMASATFHFLIASWLFKKKECTHTDMTYGTEVNELELGSLSVKASCSDSY